MTRLAALAILLLALLALLRRDRREWVIEEPEYEDCELGWGA